MTGERLKREARTIEAMIYIYCHGRHETQSGLCEECDELLNYARQRLHKCPFGTDKPTCANCKVHCYQTVMRDRIRVVMRYAGPRMLTRHPILTVYHLWDGRRKAQELSRHRRPGTGK